MLDLNNCDDYNCSRTGVPYVPHVSAREGKYPHLSFVLLDGVMFVRQEQ